MSEFIQKFINRGNISFKGLRETAVSLLPKDKTLADKLYNELKRGTEILDDDDHLNMYLHSFGNMHKAKLDTAFECIPNISDILDNGIELYDWGCGQGTATICFLDFLKRKNLNSKNLVVNLIEPSIPATSRAKDVISCYEQTIKVNVTNKEFDSLDKRDFFNSESIKVHLFSNILDVKSFDLAQFIHLFQQSFYGSNYFICVGPYYSNNKRVDEFVAATDPDEMYSILNREKGMWKNEWTISLRVFYKNFKSVESILDIRTRIEESHKKDQFFAGYILDSVSEEYTKTEIENETETLYKSLSLFDVKSNKSLDIKENCDSKVAVLANIVSRGLPTKAPVEVENYFSDFYGISEKPNEGSILNYKSTHKVTETDIFEALHIIDPRFNVDFYNGDMLESSFEKKFIDSYLKDSDNQYLIQVLEPQRPLSSIVSIPDAKFCKDQRVDFALEIPYGDANSGFVVELDGAPYHSNIFQKLRDNNRDKLSAANAWDTYRIEQLKDNSFLSQWEQNAQTNRYLSVLKKNSKKNISGDWRDILQIVLSPLAIARVERMILQALLSETLDINKSSWNILVVERDVPCAAIALKQFEESYKKISALEGSNQQLPKINLVIVSTEEFASSPLHLNENVHKSIPNGQFDLCIDVAMLLRDNIDAMPLHAKADTFYIIRSSHYKKRERTICSAESIIYPALVEKDSTGKYIAIKEREELLTYFLQNIFRKPSFRHGQLPILSHSLSDRTTIGLLPTGGGKSLTYQLSSMMQPGVTIVVDPLVSLMVDQVRGLHEIRIDASDCVNSGMDGQEKSHKLNMLENGSLQFMLLSPERYMMENFRDSLVSMTTKNQIYFAYGVIDEVHCVSEWGHDFRTSYLHLGRNMINFMQTKSGRTLPIIGLTATASFDVLADVERELTLGGNLTIDSETIVRPENDTRPELSYRIIKLDTDFESYKDKQNTYLLNVNNEWELKDIVANAKKEKIFQLINDIPADIKHINDDSKNISCRIDNLSASNFFSSDTDNKYKNAGILFCPYAHGTFGVLDNEWGTREGISTALKTQCRETLNIGTFVGGDNPSGDMKVFNENEQNLMVATKAFGMGIDKPNIRYTIHLNYPSSIESYVQEAGRGGRDKKHAISYVLFEPTEYLQLTVDKINDIRYLLTSEQNYDPIWMTSYTNKFLLWRDLGELCKSNGCSDENVDLILTTCKEQGFIENVDKDINLWFHNNSFKGIYKEKVILLELTRRILNAKETQIVNIQARLVEETGNSDIILKLDTNKNAVKLLSHENSRKQYGYIFLDSLRPNYKFIDFDYDKCQRISETLIQILQTYDDYSASALSRSIEGSENEEGIYAALQRANTNEYIFVTVTWENSLEQNFEDFETAIRQEITRIANLVDPSINKGTWSDINEDRFGPFKLANIGNFEDLLAEISKCSGDQNWLIYHAAGPYKNLKNLFWKKRDKDDTDKAIYRLCCIGLVEDVKIDYESRTYELKIKKREEFEYQNFMLDFFRKYYSLEQARKMVSQIDSYKGENYLDKCLGYLTDFVYGNLEKKRFRAIEDMRNACETSASTREYTKNDEWLKEFIHLYFNSKYARQDYEVEGESFSLKKDTDTADGCFGRSDFGIVQKYIDVISKDNSGSEVDNVKHLYGATLLCLRAHTDNAALLLLLTYCINFLGAGSNDNLKTEAQNGYIEGFMALYRSGTDDFWKLVDRFNALLEVKAREDYIKENLIKKGKETIMLFIHEEQLNNISKKYLN